MAGLPNVLTVEHECPKCGVPTIELHGLKFALGSYDKGNIELSIDAEGCYVYCPICKLDGRNEL